LIAAVGADHHGDLLIQQAQSAGIDVRYMLQLDNAQTSTYVSVLDESGDMLVAINDMSIVEQLRPEHLQAHEQMLRQASLIVADTNLGDESLAYLGETFDEQPFFVDTVSVAKAGRIRPYLDTVHTLKATQSEAEALSGIRMASNKSLPRAADWFHNHGVDRVFITLGPSGAFYSDTDGNGIEKPARAPKRIENASGAGDAFVAGLAYAWLEQWPIVKSTQFAIAAANVALSHRSTINPAMSTAAVNRICEAQYAG